MYVAAGSNLRRATSHTYSHMFRIWQSDTSETCWVSISYNAIFNENFKGIKWFVCLPWNDQVRIQYKQTILICVTKKHSPLFCKDLKRIAWQTASPCICYICWQQWPDPFSPGETPSSGMKPKSMCGHNSESLERALPWEFFLGQGFG